MEGRSPSICAAGAPPPQTQRIAGAFAAERAVVTPYTDKIDFVRKYGTDVLQSRQTVLVRCCLKKDCQKFHFYESGL
jgi:hypothetical protein